MGNKQHQKALAKYEQEEAAKANEAEQVINKRKSELKREHKILLLGAGESGKSTIFKHMKILMERPFTHDELAKYKENIFENVLKNTKSLVEAVKEFKLSFEFPENEKASKKYLDMQEYSMGSMWNASMAKEIKHLWADAAIQKAYARRVEFQLGNSAKYFFEQLDRISAANYNPSEEDLLRARIKTTGITEASFKYDDHVLRVVDVGGQRNERKKWIHCFEDITIVVWCVSLSEFDEKCYEDFTTNRLLESLQLFEETVNNKWFFTTPIILYMNKMDLLKDKCNKVKSHFPEYQGDESVQDVLQFFVKKYTSLIKNTEQRQVHVCSLTATDSNSMKQVLEETKKFIMTLPILPTKG